MGHKLLIGNGNFVGMNNIDVTVYRTGEYTCPDGSTISIPTTSTAIWMEDVNITGDPRNLTYLNKNRPYKNLLKVLVPGEGYIWIDGTKEAFEAQIAMAVTSGDDSGSYTWTVGADIPAGNYINDSRLSNKKILSISVNGIAQYTITTEPDSNILNFSSIGPLTAPSIVQIIYKNL